MDAKILCRAAQLRLTDAANFLEARVWAFGIEPASLSACRTDEIGLDALCRVTRQCRSKSESFIVGVRENSQKF
jgi:hypothetical protein